jgi:hypothetical protein
MREVASDQTQGASLANTPTRNSASSLLASGQYVITPRQGRQWNGLNDPESIAKERGFLNSLTPRVDIVMIQEHKLRGRALENLGSRLMPGCTSWILEAAPKERCDGGGACHLAVPHSSCLK